ncbi:hypothetical protein B0H17DRAFT_1135010 [Mycena rosella]|uniref:GDP-mannose transporter n=1 Tax=Mycena rosella TaxID=1033263 RepID=A0AAD7DEN8_MYCRO|nr:hypothetical protein B0H17DRAFT_1135010 [Mycena rosella]
MSPRLRSLYSTSSQHCPNKWVLNTTTAPLFFLLIQLIIAVLLFGVTDLFKMYPERLTFDLKVCKGLGPMVALNVVGLSPQFQQLHPKIRRRLLLPSCARARPPLHRRRLLRHAARPPSLRVLAACAVVTAGFFIGVLLDGTPLSFAGLAFGVASSSITALASVVIKRSLPIVDGSTILLSWYTNVLSAVVLMPLVLLAGEGPSVRALLAGAPNPAAPHPSAPQLPTFLWGSLITGAIGFLMSIAGLLSIKVTSPITHMISSAVRGVAASFLGVWFFADVISAGRGASIAVVLGGSIYYTWVKHKETEAAAGAPPASSAYERVPLTNLGTDVDLERGNGVIGNGHGNGHGNGNGNGHAIFKLEDDDLEEETREGRST